jgi:hypothetical protein
MKKIITATTLAFMFCFVFAVSFTGCEDMIGGDTTQQGKDDTDKPEEEEEVVLSPGAALPAGSLQDQIAAIAGRADKNVYYDITVTQDLVCNPMTMSTGGTNVQVTLHSDSTLRTLTLGAPGAIITVDKGVTLVLANIVLQGQPNNNWELLTVNTDGTLKMLPGAKITGNENAETTCGGVWINELGTFIMEGGEICFNKATHLNYGSGSGFHLDKNSSLNYGSGGGVFLDKGSYFNMRGGTIHHNEAEELGGGVCVYRATFIMNGGEIAANNAYYGGGVYIRGFIWSWDYNDLFEKKPLPGTMTSGVIWGYPANGKENYANGPTVYYDWNDEYYSLWRESTLGEYDSISTAWRWNGNVVLDLESGWEYIE